MEEMVSQVGTPLNVLHYPFILTFELKNNSFYTNFLPLTLKNTHKMYMGQSNSVPNGLPK